MGASLVGPDPTVRVDVKAQAAARRPDDLQRMAFAGLEPMRGDHREPIAASPPRKYPVTSLRGPLPTVRTDSMGCAPRRRRCR